MDFNRRLTLKKKVSLCQGIDGEGQIICRKLAKPNALPSRQNVLWDQVTSSIYKKLRAYPKRICLVFCQEKLKCHLYTIISTAMNIPEWAHTASIYIQHLRAEFSLKKYPRRRQGSRGHQCLHLHCGSCRWKWFYKQQTKRETKVKHMSWSSV